MAKDKVSSTEKKLGRYAKKIERYGDRATDILSQLSQSAYRLKSPTGFEGNSSREVKLLEKNTEKLRRLVRKICVYLSLISEILPYDLRPKYVQESKEFKAEPLYLAKELENSVYSIIAFMGHLNLMNRLITAIDKAIQLCKQTTKWSYGALVRSREIERRAKS